VVRIAVREVRFEKGDVPRRPCATSEARPARRRASDHDRERPTAAEVQGVLDTAGVEVVDLCGQTVRGGQLHIWREGVTLVDAHLYMWGGPATHRWADGSEAQQSTVALNVSASRTTLERVRVTGTNYWRQPLRAYDNRDANCGSGVLIHGGARDVLLSDCVIADNSLCGIHVVGPATEVHLARCSVSGNMDNGIVADDGATLFVAGSSVTRSRGYGILARLQSEATLSGVAVVKNRGSGLGAAMRGQVVVRPPYISMGNFQEDQEVGGVVGVPIPGEKGCFASLSEAYSCLETTRGKSIVKRIKAMNEANSLLEGGGGTPSTPTRAPIPPGGAASSRHVQAAPGRAGGSDWERTAPRAQRQLLQGLADEEERGLGLLESMVHSALRMKATRRDLADALSPPLRAKLDEEKEGVVLWES